MMGKKTGKKSVPPLPYTVCDYGGLLCVCAYNSIKLAPAPPPPGFSNAAKKEREKKELITENIEKIDAAAVRQKMQKK